MRLIDADDVKKMISDTFEKEKDVINSFWKVGTLIDKVDEIQTAYNVDAVVKQLEEHFNATNDKGARLAYHHAIKIVKGGGVDD